MKKIIVCRLHCDSCSTQGGTTESTGRVKGSSSLRNMVEIGPRYEPREDRVVWVWKQNEELKIRLEWKCIKQENALMYLGGSCTGQRTGRRGDAG